MKKQAPRIRVLIADSQPLFAEILSRALAKYDDISVAETRPNTANDAVQAVIAHAPDVAIVDYWMPDLKGSLCAAQITAWVPTCKVLLLSWLHGPAEIEGAMAAGATGFLPRSIKVDEILDAVRRVDNGESPVLAAELARLITKLQARQDLSHAAWERLNVLTHREKQVLGLLSLGLPASDISKRLFLATSTVNEHVNNILRKFEVKSSAQAVAIAHQVGLVQTSPTAEIP